MRTGFALIRSDDSLRCCTTRTDAQGRYSIALPESERDEVSSRHTSVLDEADNTVRPTYTAFVDVLHSDSVVKQPTHGEIDTVLVDMQRSDSLISDEGSWGYCIAPSSHEDHRICLTHW